MDIDRYPDVGWTERSAAIYRAGEEMAGKEFAAGFVYVLYCTIYICNCSNSKSVLVD